MQRLFTPVIFLVWLLGGLSSLHAQADLQPDYYYDCPTTFQNAVDELEQEKFDTVMAMIAIAEEHQRVMTEELDKARPDFFKLIRLANEAAALQEMMHQTLIFLDKTEGYLYYTQQKWKEMVDKANQLDVGHPRQYFSGPARAELAALALQVRSGMQHTNAAHADAMWWEQTARNYVPYTLLNGIEDVFVALLQQHGATSSAINDYFSGCIGLQPRRIIGIVVANLHAFVNDGPNGEITALKAHPSYLGQFDIVDISDAFKLEDDGETHRSLRIGYEIPYDARFGADVKGAADELLAQQGDPLATNHNGHQTVPNFSMNGSTFENDGNGLTLHYRLIDGNIAAFCAGEHPDQLVAGESDSCPLTLKTTGSPEQIANGETVHETYEVFAMGDGVSYLSFIVKIEADLEAPSDPCYIWDPVTESYIIDYSNADCGGGGQGPGGDNPPGPGGGDPGGGNPGGGNPGGGLGW